MNTLQMMRYASINRTTYLFVSQSSQYWLADIPPQLNQLLQDKSVSLRLQSGTQEAGFLASICPIPKLPAVVVIK